MLMALYRIIFLD